MSMVDSAMAREVMREIARRPLDYSNLEVHVTNGVVQLRGRIEKLRGYYEDTDLHEEIQIIVRCLKQRSDIRDVQCEVELGGPSIKERLTPHPKRVTY